MRLLVLLTFLASSAATASDGKISGTVRGPLGEPVVGMRAVAFCADADGQPSGAPVRIAATNARGEYALDELPPDNYIVGLNVDPDANEISNPPEWTSAIRLAEHQSVAGLDVALKPPRVPAKIVVTVTNSEPVPGGVILSLYSPGGRRRWQSDQVHPLGTPVTLPAYMGETYRVRARALAEDKTWEAELKIDLPGPEVRITLPLAKVIAEHRTPSDTR